MAGALVSAGVHALLATVLVRYGDQLAAAKAEEVLALRPDPERPPPPEKPEPPDRKADGPKPIRLGIAKSDADTLTWLGYEEATEHQAEKGLTDQSAMTIAAPGPVTPTPPSPEAAPTPEMPPAPAVAEAPAAPEPAPEAAAAPEPPSPPIELPDPREIAEALEQTSDRLVAMARDLAKALEAAMPPPPPPQSPLAAKPEPKPESPAPAAPPPRPATPPMPASGNSGLPGLPADREAIAAAVRKSPKVQPGKVLAAQGLEILTRQPRWDLTTTLTRRPRNPTLLITFTTQGAVKSVEFVRDGVRVYSTGSPEVDEPLLNSVYSWTARGKPLEEAAAKAAAGGGDPEVTIMLTIILVG